MVVDQYLLGWILASVLGLIAVYSTVAKSRSNRRALLAERSECVKSVTVSNAAECRSAEDDVDVIIVGAGVAGSALAHTLGKVLNCFPLFIFSVNKLTYIFGDLRQ